VHQSLQWGFFAGSTGSGEEFAALNGVVKVPS
jgi:hypothetical protein